MSRALTQEGLRDREEPMRSLPEDTGEQALASLQLDQKIELLSASGSPADGDTDRSGTGREPKGRCLHSRTDLGEPDLQKLPGGLWLAV